MFLKKKSDSQNVALRSKLFLVASPVLHIQGDPYETL